MYPEEKSIFLSKVKNFIFEVEAWLLLMGLLLVGDSLLFATPEAHSSDKGLWLGIGILSSVGAITLINIIKGKHSGK